MERGQLDIYNRSRATKRASMQANKHAISERGCGKARAVAVSQLQAKKQSPTKEEQSRTERGGRKYKQWRVIKWSVKW